jgi:hypothetical protein
VRQKNICIFYSKHKKYFIMEQTLQGLSPKAETLIEKENKYGAHYHPLPVVLDRGEGVLFGMWTVRNIMIFCLRILP